jgi:hypothetical protein
MAGIIAPQHHDERAARKYLEKLLWPDGPVCPKCGLLGEAYKLGGETTREGLYKCAGCRAPFTVTMGTIFEDSHIPLHKWLYAIYLMCSSKKGISAHQLWRNLWGVNELTGRPNGSYKSAWFMAHRIRWALGQEPVAGALRGVFEIDEVWIGGKQRLGSVATDEGKHAKRWGKDVRDNKTPVTTILHREGDVHSYPRVTGEQLRPIVSQMIDKAESHIMTDSASKLKFSRYGWKHSAVNHSIKEYARHEDGLTITTNTVEGYFAIIRRGVDGIYHHVGSQYLDQYLREFDFRYNVRRLNDRDRNVLAVRKTTGKRMTLRTPKGS